MTELLEITDYLFYLFFDKLFNDIFDVFFN